MGDDFEGEGAGFVELADVLVGGVCCIVGDSGDAFGLVG